MPDGISQAVSHTRQWDSGYKLHTAVNTGSQADIQDSQCTRNNISTSARSTSYMAADCGYDDDHELYDLSITRGFELLCSVS